MPSWGLDKKLVLLAMEDVKYGVGAPLYGY